MQKAKPNLTREYLVLASRPGGFMNWPSYSIRSNARIRTSVIVMFRKWFGREPVGHWHKDGFMAEAWDERGNRIELEQVNRDWSWKRESVMAKERFRQRGGPLALLPLRSQGLVIGTGTTKTDAVRDFAMAWKN